MQASIQNGYFKNCDYYARLDANEGTSVINPGGYFSILGYFGYLGFYEPGSSCRYFIECPHNYVIRLYCDINVAATVKKNPNEQFIDGGAQKMKNSSCFKKCDFIGRSK